MIPLDTQEGEKQKGKNWKKMGQEILGMEMIAWGLSVAESFVGNEVFVHPHLDDATIQVEVKWHGYCHLDDITHQDGSQATWLSPPWPGP